MKRSISSCLGSIVVLIIIFFILGKVIDAISHSAGKAKKKLSDNTIISTIKSIWNFLGDAWDFVVGGTARLLHVNQFWALIILVIIGAFLFSNKKTTS